MTKSFAVQHVKDKISATVRPGIMPLMHASDRTADPDEWAEGLRVIPMRAGRERLTRWPTPFRSWPTPRHALPRSCEGELIRLQPRRSKWKRNDPPYDRIQPAVGVGK